MDVYCNHTVYKVLTVSHIVLPLVLCWHCLHGLFCRFGSGKLLLALAWPGKLLLDGMQTMYCFVADQQENSTLNSSSIVVYILYVTVRLLDCYIT
jgi:hypothetical protein